MHKLVSIIKTKKCNQFKLTSVNEWLIAVLEVDAMGSLSSHAAILVTTAIEGSLVLGASFAGRRFRLLVGEVATELEQIDHVLIFISLDCLAGERLALVYTHTDTLIY